MTRTRRITLVCAALGVVFVGTGLRRAGGGCLQSRFLEVRAGGDSSGNLVSDATRTRVFTALDLAPLSPFDTVSWRGDANSYVDVFDVPIQDETTSSAEFGQLVRLRYPRSLVDPFVYEVRPKDIAATLGLPLPY